MSCTVTNTTMDKKKRVRFKRPSHTDNDGKWFITPSFREMAVDFLRTEHRRRESIIRWARRYVNGITIENFTTSWQDGTALCALIGRLHSETDHLLRETNPLHRVNNCRIALKRAQMYFSIPPDLITAEEIVIGSPSTEVKMVKLLLYLRWKQRQRLRKKKKVRISEIFRLNKRNTLDECMAKGPGLSAASVGKEACFTIHYAHGSETDIKVSIKVPIQSFEEATEVMGERETEGEFDKPNSIIPSSSQTNSGRDYNDDKNIYAGALLTREKNDKYEDVEFNYKGTNPNESLVSYIPRRCGLHNVNILWKGNSIPGSPFIVCVKPNANPKRTAKQWRKGCYNKAFWKRVTDSSENTFLNSINSDEPIRDPGLDAENNNWGQVTVTNRRILKRVITKGSFEQILIDSQNDKDATTDKSDNRDRTNTTLLTTDIRDNMKETDCDEEKEKAKKHMLYRQRKQKLEINHIKDCRSHPGSLNNTSVISVDRGKSFSEHLDTSNYFNSITEIILKSALSDAISPLTGKNNGEQTSAKKHTFPSSSGSSLIVATSNDYNQTPNESTKPPSVKTTANALVHSDLTHHTSTGDKWEIEPLTAIECFRKHYINTDKNLHLTSQNTPFLFTHTYTPLLYRSSNDLPKTDNIVSALNLLPRPENSLEAQLSLRSVFFNVFVKIFDISKIPNLEIVKQFVLQKLAFRFGLESYHELQLSPCESQPLGNIGTHQAPVPETKIYDRTFSEILNQSDSTSFPILLKSDAGNNVSKLYCKVPERMKSTAKDTLDYFSGSRETSNGIHTNRNSQNAVTTNGQDIKPFIKRTTLIQNDKHVRLSQDAENITSSNIRKEKRNSPPNNEQELSVRYASPFQLVKRNDKSCTYLKNVDIEKFKNAPEGNQQSCNDFEKYKNKTNTPIQQTQEHELITDSRKTDSEDFENSSENDQQYRGLSMPNILEQDNNKIKGAYEQILKQRSKVVSTECQKNITSNIKNYETRNSPPDKGLEVSGRCASPIQPVKNNEKSCSYGQNVDIGNFKVLAGNQQNNRVAEKYKIKTNSPIQQNSEQVLILDGQNADSEDFESASENARQNGNLSFYNMLDQCNNKTRGPGEQILELNGKTRITESKKNKQVSSQSESTVHSTVSNFQSHDVNRFVLNMDENIASKNNVIPSKILNCKHNCEDYKHPTEVIQVDERSDCLANTSMEAQPFKVIEKTKRKLVEQIKNFKKIDFGVQNGVADKGTQVNYVDITTETKWTSHSDLRRTRRKRCFPNDDLSQQGNALRHDTSKAHSATNNQRTHTWITNNDFSQKADVAADSGISLLESPNISYNRGMRHPSVYTCPQPSSVSTSSDADFVKASEKSHGSDDTGEFRGECLKPTKSGVDNNSRHDGYYISNLEENVVPRDRRHGVRAGGIHNHSGHIHGAGIEKGQLFDKIHLPHSRKHIMSFPKCTNRDNRYTENSSPENHSVLNALYNRVHIGQNGSQAANCCCESSRTHLNQTLSGQSICRQCRTTTNANAHRQLLRKSPNFRHMFENCSLDGQLSRVCKDQIQVSDHCPASIPTSYNPFQGNINHNTNERDEKQRFNTESKCPKCCNKAHCDTEMCLNNSFTDHYGEEYPRSTAHSCPNCPQHFLYYNSDAFSFPRKKFVAHRKHREQQPLCQCSHCKIYVDSRHCDKNSVQMCNSEERVGIDDHNELFSEMREQNVPRRMHTKVAPHNVTIAQSSPIREGDHSCVTDNGKTNEGAHFRFDRNISLLSSEKVEPSVVNVDNDSVFVHNGLSPGKLKFSSNTSKLKPLDMELDFTKRKGQHASDYSHIVCYSENVSNVQDTHVNDIEGSFPDTPLSLDICTPSDDNSCQLPFATGPGLSEGGVNVKNFFQVHVGSVEGGPLTVSIEGPRPHSVFATSVTYTGDNIYDVTYEVEDPGYYIINIGWGKSIKGSPFTSKIIY